MALWLQKHEPKSLGELSCHPSINQQLTNLAAKGNVPNLILYGQPGSGRTTRIRAFLQSIYGDGVHQLKANQLEIANKAVDIFQISSNHHVEISADEMGRRDRDVVTTLIKKTVGQTNNVFSTTGPSFRVVVIKDADQLSWDAQAALRRTMETYFKNCRIFLVCESLNKLMKPLRSRCLCIRVPLPSHDEVLDVLKSVAVKEALTPKVEYLSELAKVSRRSLERSILLLELAAIQGYPSASNLAYLPWEMSVVGMVKDIVTKPSPQTMLDIRNSAYELFASNLPMADVLELVHRLLMTHLSDDNLDLKLKLTRFANKFGSAMTSCQNEVVQLEAFFASTAYTIRQKQIESGL